MNIRSALIFIVACALLELARAQNAPEPGGVQVERDRITQERAAAEQHFKDDSVVCYQRFRVNDCLDTASKRKRVTLADLRRQEIVINNAERKRKGAEETQRLEDKSGADKQQEKADKREEALQATQDRADSAQQKKQDRLARQANEQAKQADHAAKLQSANDKAAERAKKAAGAAQKKAELADKQAKADQRRADLAKRLADQDKPPANPLPAQP